MSFLNHLLQDKRYRWLQQLLLMIRIAWQVSLAVLGLPPKSQS